MVHTKVDICRLCSTDENLIYMFDEQRQKRTELLRHFIWLATGIEIKENDIVSKMVCHRCCEIAVKLHKYRTNAVSNDKLLKEQIGLPYTSPITDQAELLRIASHLVNEQKGASNVNITNNSCLHYDPLELLNTSFKKEGDNTKDNKSSIPDLTKAVNNSASSLNKRKIIPKVKYKHSSVKQLFKTYKTIVLPEEVFKSDISPVISLNSEEVNDWYTEQLSVLKTKLTGITFKQIPHNSNHTTASAPTVPSKSNVTTGSAHDAVPSTRNAVPPKHSEVTSSKHNKVTARKHTTVAPRKNVVGSSDHCSVISQNRKRTYSQIVEARNSDSDDIYGDESQQFNSDYEQENDIPQTNFIRNVPSTNQPPNNVNSQIPTDQHVATSSNNLKPHQQQTAKKRTGRRRSTTKRKRLSSKESHRSEREKKTKATSSKTSSNIPNGISLPRECLLEIAEQETFRTSSLELTCSESPPELITGKTLAVFMCSVCNKLYDTKKELADHEKTHLKCKFCKKRLRNLVLLEKHQNESCFINIVKNKPIIKLKKVDTIPSVLKQYADAFQQPNEDENTTTNFCENIDDTNESRPDIEEVVLRMPFENPFIESEETTTTMNLTAANNEQNSDVICISISDDSGDEIEFKAICRHKIVDNPFNSDTVVSPSKEAQSATVDLTVDNSTPSISDTAKSNLATPPPNILREKEMIRSLFKKHSYPLEKRENESQTFTPANYNVKYTNTNLIILEGMFTELSAYKIPVYLESQPKISARFRGNISIPESPASLECWAFKKPIDIERRVRSCATPTPSDKPTNNAVLNVVNTPPTTSKMLGTVSNITELLFKTPSVLEGLTTNLTMPVAKTTFSTANAVPFTLSPAASNNFYTKQPNSFVQFLEASNAVQHQTPVVPQSSSSLVLETNKDRDKNHRSENMLHVSNNITNINKFYVLASNVQQIPTRISNVNNMQQIPTRISNLNYGTSFLNNLCANLQRPREPPAEIREVETVNQNSSVVLYNANDEAVQAVNQNSSVVLHNANAEAVQAVNPNSSVVLYNANAEAVQAVNPNSSVVLYNANAEAVQAVNPNSSVVLYNANDEAVQASNNRLRVKNILELNQ